MLSGYGSDGRGDGPTGGRNLEGEGWSFTHGPKIGKPVFRIPVYGDLLSKTPNIEGSSHYEGRSTRDVGTVLLSI